VARLADELCENPIPDALATIHNALNVQVANGPFTSFFRKVIGEPPAISGVQVWEGVTREWQSHAELSGQ
jgi:hypothetical protein